MDLFDPNDDRLERLGLFGRMAREGAQLVDQLAAQDTVDDLAGAITALDDRGMNVALMFGVMFYKKATTSDDEFRAWYLREPS